MKRMPAPSAPARPTICVFCGSSHGTDPVYTEAARAFGAKLVEAEFDLVFGGGGIGLMGEVALAVSKAGGGILGILPSFLRHLEPPLSVASEIIIAETMNERKARMFAAADGFAVLPGGPGTLDEFSEAFTYAQLGLHAKPIVLVNIKDYFAPMIALIDHFVAEGFASAHVKELFHVAPTVEDAIAIFTAHQAKLKQPAE
jgi:uncharacterized protein (TIGR00730 family)